jgi:SAM-dependent methyltransferase
MVMPSVVSREKSHDRGAGAPVSGPKLTRMQVFDRQPLVEILDWIDARLRAGDEVAFVVADPDRGRGLHAGETVALDGRAFVHRPYRVWVDLAERRRLRMLTPRVHADGRVCLRFEPLRDEAAAPTEDRREKYGVASEFARVHKLEDPSFVIDFAEAIERVGLRPGARVLDIGVNTGDELALLHHVLPGVAPTLTVVGVDHSHSAITTARDRFPGDNVTFIEGDINELERLDEAPFDLVICIGTLQSPGVDDRAVLRHLVQRRLTPAGALLLGFPNSRYLDGEVLFGARMKNFRQPELSLLVKGLAFYKTYLQQHRRHVYITGKHDVLVTAVPKTDKTRSAGTPADG